MKKLIMTAAISLGVISGAAAAQAQDLSYYAGIGLGAVSVDYKATGIDQKKASFGGYAKFGADINDYFAAELRIGATGKDKKTYPAMGTLAFSSPTFVSYLAKFKYPAMDNADLYLVAGGTTARIKGTLGGVSQTQTKTGFSLGAGFDYKLDDQVSIGAEWVQYMFPVKLKAGPVFANGSKARMWGITGTASYHF